MVTGKYIIFHLILYIHVRRKELVLLEYKNNLTKIKKTHYKFFLKFEIKKVKIYNLI